MEGIDEDLLQLLAELESVSPPSKATTPAGASSRKQCEEGTWKSSIRPSSAGSATAGGGAEKPSNSGKQLVLDKGGGDDTACIVPLSKLETWVWWWMPGHVVSHLEAQVPSLRLVTGPEERVP